MSPITESVADYSGTRGKVTLNTASTGKAPGRNALRKLRLAHPAAFTVSDAQKNQRRSEVRLYGREQVVSHRNMIITEAAKDGGEKLLRKRLERILFNNGWDITADEKNIKFDPHTEITLLLHKKNKVNDARVLMFGTESVLKR